MWNYLYSKNQGRCSYFFDIFFLSNSFYLYDIFCYKFIFLSFLDKATQNNYYYNLNYFNQLGIIRFFLYKFTLNTIAVRNLSE